MRRCFELEKKISRLQLKCKQFSRVKSQLKYKLKIQKNLPKHKNTAKEISNDIKNLPHISDNAKTLANLIISDRKPNSTYSSEQRRLAMNVYYKSNSAYSYLRNRLNIQLPHKNSLNSWTPVKHLEPGFNKEIIDVLRKQIQSLDTRGKHCTLLFDGMAIRKELAYDQYSDQVFGFDTSIGSKEIATEITTFMIRGDFEQWKCVVSYFPSKNSMSSDQLCVAIMKNIEILFEIGYIVTTVISDQASYNRSCYKKLNISRDEPFLIYDSRKIIFIYDICHLIKNIRNLLLGLENSSKKTNQNCFLETPDGSVSWTVVRALHELDIKNTTKLCPKYSDRHINVGPFDKMNVKLAVQVLSHSSAAAIRTVLDHGLFPEKIANVATSTANFIEKIDNLFDCLNSSQISNFRKPLNSALKKDNDVYKYLCFMKNYLMNVSCSHTKVYWIDGLIQTISGILTLADNFFSDENLNVHYMLTARKNSDQIENFHGDVRGYNGFNRNPSVKEFNHIIGKIMSMKLISYVSNLKNCEPDDGEYLTHSTQQLELDNSNEKNYVKYLNICEELPEENISLFLESYCENETNLETETLNFTLQDSSLRYFSGYCLFVFFKKTQCDSCSNVMTKSEKVAENKSELLILNKSYDKQCDFGSLVAPSDFF